MQKNKDKEKIKYLQEQILRLSEIRMALSTEKNTDALFEMILDEATRITQADGRTLYTINKEGNLNFEILGNDTMNQRMGGPSGLEIPYYPVKLYLQKVLIFLVQRHLTKKINIDLNLFLLYR